jgi:DNA replication ATP-dependent helicase Dna2
VCIVDEAGQITLPATLGPLLRARSFVLVGDPHQLPPLVTSKAADEAGLSTPLFQRLAQAHPASVTALPVQYRMAEDIQALPNALVYDGKLRCGNEHVATQTLALKCFARGPASKEEEEEQEKEDASPRRACAKPVGAIPGVVGADAATWLLQHVLDPTRRVVFLDTTHVFARFQETAHEDVVCNEGEARLLLALAATLAVHGGLAQKALGVISPYNRQVNTVRRLMDAQGLREVECLTVDKAQGRDKECVLVSFVRANEERQPGKLLADVRRVNVALTRAKAKLVMVGHAATLKKLPLFEKLLDECQKRKWVVDVSPLVVA